MAPSDKKRFDIPDIFKNTVKAHFAHKNACIRQKAEFSSLILFHKMSFK